jgi:hypothetical protein
VSVAVPFIVAIGFGIAATTVFLVDKLGSLYAYLTIGGAFTLIGLMAALVVSVKEQEEAAETKVEATDTASVATDAAAQAAVQAPLALLGTLFATPAGPAMLAGGTKALARNIPLVVLLALIGMLFWPVGEKAPAEDAAEANGAYPPVPNGLHRQAA